MAKNIKKYYWIGLIILIIVICGCQIKNEIQQDKPEPLQQAQAGIWVVKLKDNSYMNLFSAQIKEDYSISRYSITPLSQNDFYPLERGYHLLYGENIPEDNIFVLVNLEDSSQVSDYLHSLKSTKDDSKLIKDPFSEWYICDKVNQGINKGMMPDEYPALYNEIIFKNELNVYCSQSIHNKLITS